MSDANAEADLNFNRFSSPPSGNGVES